MSENKDGVKNETFDLQQHQPIRSSEISSPTTKSAQELSAITLFLVLMLVDDVQRGSSCVCLVLVLLVHNTRSEQVRSKTQPTALVQRHMSRPPVSQTSSACSHGLTTRHRTATGHARRKISSSSSPRRAMLSSDRKRCPSAAATARARRRSRQRSLVSYSRVQYLSSHH